MYYVTNIQNYRKKIIKADQICAKNTHIDLSLRHKKKTLKMIWNEISNVL